MQRSQLTRLLSWGGLLLVCVAAALLVFSSGSSYVVKAEFTDAGQLVSGDRVVVGGHQVGSVGSISLSDDGLAVIDLDISDSSLQPLSSTTTATIGQLSLTGVANRFVSLTPGVGGTSIPSGGVLPATQTRGIVELDSVLDSFTPSVRRSLQQILHAGAAFYQAPTGTQLAEVIDALNPALSQISVLGGQVVDDKDMLQQFVSSTAKVSGALASHDAALGGSVTNLAATLQEIAGERAAISDALSRAPTVLGQTDAVLRHVDTTLGSLNPTLVALKPVAAPLASLLTELVPFTEKLGPTVNGINGLLPAAETSLRAFLPAGKAALPAFESLDTALKGVNPILSGLRPYVPDLVAGLFNGVGGSTGAGYDADGHFLRVRFMTDTTTSALSALLSELGVTVGGGGLGSYFQNRQSCPGGGSFPAWDGSAPWASPDSDASLGSLCVVSEDPR